LGEHLVVDFLEKIPCHIDGADTRDRTECTSSHIGDVVIIQEQSPEINFFRREKGRKNSELFTANLRKRIPRKLLLSNLLILLLPMCSTFNTELRAKVPLQKGK